MAGTARYVFFCLFPAGSPVRTCLGRILRDVKAKNGSAANAVIYLAAETTTADCGAIQSARGECDGAKGGVTIRAAFELVQRRFVPGVAGLGWAIQAIEGTAVTRPAARRIGAIQAARGVCHHAAIGIETPGIVILEITQFDYLARLHLEHGKDRRAKHLARGIGDQTGDRILLIYTETI